MSVVFALIAFILVIVIVHGELCKPPNEEGTSFILQANPFNYNMYVAWQVFKNGEFTEVTRCIKQGNCTSLHPDRYISSFKLDENGTLWFLLLINQSDRDENYFQALVDGGYNQQCALDIYVKPEKPICQRPVLDRSNTYLSVSCTTTRVFPGVYCSLVIRSDDPINATVAYHYNQTISPVSSKDLSITCTANVLLKDLITYDVQFKVEMLPNVTKGCKACLVESDWTSPIVVRQNASGVLISEYHLLADYGYNFIAIAVGTSSAACLMVIVAAAFMAWRCKVRKETKQPYQHHGHANGHINAIDEETYEYPYNITPSESAPYRNNISASSRDSGYIYPN